MKECRMNINMRKTKVMKANDAVNMKVMEKNRKYNRLKSTEIYLVC